MNRRKFFEVVAGAAAAGAILSQTGGDANAAAQQYLYQDSFGNVGPAGQDAVNLGVFPPPIPEQQEQQNQQGAIFPEHRHSRRFQAAQDAQPPASANNTYYNQGYPRHNVLLVVVDQMRNPALWLPANNGVGAQNQVWAAIPHIANLASQSFYFPCYYTAATVCGPARTSMQTGAYAQQHCLFRSSANPLRPYNANWTADGLNGAPGFPTIGNVLSQSILSNGNASNANYNCTFIGKWHLSCPSGTAADGVGSNGPRDYGYATSADPAHDYCIPRGQGANPYSYVNSAAGYPSPNGLENQGVTGDFLDSYGQSAAGGRDVPTGFTGTVPTTPDGSLVELNDTAIQEAFIKWLAYAATNLSGNVNGQLINPWFCTVSFVNPHDITDFPFSFGLTGQGNSNFTDPTQPPANGYQPAPPSATAVQTFYGNNCAGGTNNTQCTADGDYITVPKFQNVFTSLPPGTGNSGRWNWEDVTTPAYSSGGKPGLQAYFLGSRAVQTGGIESPGSYNNGNNTWATPTAWDTFLNYYFWMQSCVDAQVGAILTGPNGLIQNSEFWNNTIIIFTADHGDYGGSHGLHAKGGAAYEESINVPLYVSYPSMRPANGANNTGPYSVPYACSSVDLLPFLYSLVLGNASWRSNNNDLVYYLRNREAIEDAIYQYQLGAAYPQRRISGIPLYHGNQTCGQTCQDYQEYQPFVLHTADDYSKAYTGTQQNPTYHPSHIVAFRTVDFTDVNSSSAPFYPGNSYGGGKLVEYGYWDTNDQTTAPIMPINATVKGVDATNEYEFYNYSPHPATGTLSANPQEVGNQYFDQNLNVTSEANAYLTNFNDPNPAHGVTIQNELYYVNSSGGGPNTQQVAAAVKQAWIDYQNYLAQTCQLAGSNGRPLGCTQAANNNYVRWDNLFDPL